MSSAAIEKIIKKVYKKAEINDEDYCVHTLRHTCATLLYRKGINIRTIQELLGHVQIDTTGYNLEYMLNGNDATEEQKQEKISMLKYTYEQILASQANK